MFRETFQYRGITIWGASETNVYVGRHESDYGGRKSLFRYDGTKWNAIDLRRFGLGTITAISGIDSSNFIVVGNGGRLAHAGLYRNGVWDTLPLPTHRPYVLGVHMVSPTEMYICGVDGVLRHDGNTHTWIVDSSRSVSDPTKAFPFWPFGVRKGSDGKLYFVALLEQPNVVSYRLEHAQGKSQSDDATVQREEDEIEVVMSIQDVETTQVSTAPNNPPIGSNKKNKGKRKP